MINYDTIPNTVGTFPNVVSVNATGPGTTDGTPYLKSVIDDLWGARQALLDSAGMSPDAVTESAGASQQLEAIQKIAGYPGEMVCWMGASADPSVLGIRLLHCAGQGILRSSYPDLDTAVYVGDTLNPTADAFYHADDAGGSVRNTAGIYLILVDTRYEFVRGENTEDTPGTWEDYKLLNHQHEVYSNTGNTLWPTLQVLGNPTGATSAVYGSSSSGSPGLFGTTIYNPSSKVDSNENVPENVMVRFAIRY